MLLKLRALSLALSAALLLGLPACSSAQPATAIASAPATQFQAVPTELPAGPTAASLPVRIPNLTVRVTPSPTVEPVTITAVHGDLAIRSGPDPVFDAIDTLKQGETAPVLARSVLDGWVQIPMPDQAPSTGWVSIKTIYSVVTGNVLDLPEIMTVEWPFGSYIRNCTEHRMLVEPTDQQLAALSGAPQNRAWFAPGLYDVHDLDAAGQPFVVQIKLTEHTQVDIRFDGDRQRGSCP